MMMMTITAMMTPITIYATIFWGNTGEVSLVLWAETSTKVNKLVKTSRPMIGVMLPMVP